MAAAADHARGLVEQDAALLSGWRSATGYRCPRYRAGGSAAPGRPGQPAQRGGPAAAGGCPLRGARLGRGRGPGAGWLRALGTRLCHWTHQDRPAFGWDSLTDTERTIADLVAEGLSNRQVASRVFLSTHTVAFHLRHVFWKLGVTSRVQLARMAAEQAATG
jgi:DNA-binding CsgD family transcriptional regulator